MSSRRKHSVSPDVTRRLISDTAAESKLHKRKRDESPPVEEWKRQFPGKVKLDETTGDFSLSLTDRGDIKRAMEMQDGSRKAEIEIGEYHQAKLQREKVVRRDGRMVEFPQELVEGVKHRFKGSPGRNGGAPSLRFGLSESFGKYKQGLDELWFVWNDGWEPTKLWMKAGLSGVQRDPDGNVWTRAGDEWVLEDEVSE
jgi:hypothetical protein